MLTKTLKPMSKLKVDTRKEGNKHQSFDVKYRTIKLNLLEQVAATNALLRGKKLFAKMLRDETANCFLSCFNTLLGV
ncbi:hypothetical protein [Colwellia sp. E2M01]|uniref:hypothetical protein n=1 Tax=Colwellia sp. E2M01 TaxID=2841561 RepID=UPI001C095AD1|nr:hypothetical protein [Colwellia sp. E2M01]MBU2870533.1 hypothetical protein [Colwellia sp. E2M01]